MLGFETYYARNFEQATSISNGRAWSLVPYAWEQIKPSTLRNCFAATPVLPTQMRENLRRQRPTKEEQPPKPRYTHDDRYKEQEKVYFQHLVAEIGKENGVNFRVVESKEEPVGEALRQVMAEEGWQNNTDGEEAGGQDNVVRDGDEYSSSPLADADVDFAVLTLKGLTGPRDFLSNDGITQVRQNVKQGKGHREIGKAVKHLVRACLKQKH